MSSAPILASPSPAGKAPQPKQRLSNEYLLAELARRLALTLPPQYDDLVKRAERAEERAKLAEDLAERAEDRAERAEERAARAEPDASGEFLPVTAAAVEARDYTFVGYYPRRPGHGSRKFLVPSPFSALAGKQAMWYIRKHYAPAGPLSVGHGETDNISLYPRNYVREARDLVNPPPTV
jgi:hypothetical protein